MKGDAAIPLSLTLYGATDCDDTQRTRQRLHELGLPFHEVNIDQDEEAEHFVRFINCGFRSTPTLVFGQGRFKIIATEPSDQELDQLLIQSGNLMPSQT